jgi:hypothetical protein
MNCHLSNAPSWYTPTLQPGSADRETVDRDEQRPR